jgi:prepilin-type N-terminal cleavage/methylation domain-containing protein
MDYQIKSIKKLQSGFTLVEMVVVMVIIGILVSVSTSAYNSFKTHENLEIATVGSLTIHKINT